MASSQDYSGDQPIYFPPSKW